ncbi:unnamed protein product [Nezara viridula]|uniref:U1-type domain-containing protein n=1 Tax=Nezara viridula TaxID=85310 RepID=A0A9P0MNH7_NEZVI|nr:unnamed protein product [Nezara viridula]
MVFCNLYKRFYFQNIIGKMIRNYTYSESVEMYEESLEKEDERLDGYSMPPIEEQLEANIVDKYYCSYCDITLSSSDLEDHIYDTKHQRNMEEVALNTRRRNLEAVMKTLASGSTSNSDRPRKSVMGKEVVIKKKLISSNKRTKFPKSSDDEVADDEDGFNTSASEEVYPNCEMFEKMDCW